MTQEPAAPDLWGHPLARNYGFLCVGALAVLTLALVLRGYGFWSCLPPIVGLLGVLTRWRGAPVLVLLLVVVMQEELWYLLIEGQVVWTRPRPVDLILAGALLAYFAGQFRLMSLFRHILPPDARYRAALLQQSVGTLRVPHMPQRALRSAGTIQVREIAVLLATVPLWTVAAWLLWAALPKDWYHYNLTPHVWRAVVLLWVLGAGSLIVAAIVGYLGRLRMSRSEAAQFIQDALWHDTRGPMRHLSRWLAWARLPAHHRKDLP